MPSPDEIAAAAKAMHNAREKSRVGGSPYPSIEDEARIALEAAEEVRAVPRNPGMVPKRKFKPD
jgi:hypothetical protein